MIFKLFLELTIKFNKQNRESFSNALSEKLSLIMADTYDKYFNHS